jgi:hypothetical protein
MNLDQFNPGNLVAISFKACFSKNKLYAKSILILVFACFFSATMAQHRSRAALTYGGGSNGGGEGFESGYGIAFGIGYDAPLGYLKDIYKPAIAYNLGISRFLGNFTIGLNAAYHAYKPKDGLITVEVDGSEGADPQVTDYSNIFTKLKVFEGYASAVYNIDVADGVKLNGGLNLGGYYTVNVVPYFTSDETVVPLEQHLRNFYVAPRLGFVFLVSDQIALTLDGKYNFFAPTAKSQYDTGTGTFYTTVAVQAGVIVKL